MRQGIKAIGGNGQISPVSGNSMANFTENDNKFSLGSYQPSYISSYGGPPGRQGPNVDIG